MDQEATVHYELREVLRVLSIDFDYIMFPCIKLYNQYCVGKENDTQIWKKIFETFDESFLDYDARALEQIFSLIVKNVQNGAQFIPIREHDEIISSLFSLENYENLMFDVTNIDFHHDLFYGEHDIAGTKCFNDSTCANWFGYLYVKNRVHNGTWVKAPNSFPYIFADIEPVEITELSMKDIPNIETDYNYVFFCLSPQWVPEKFHHLYDMICHIVEEIQKEQNHD